MRPSLLRTTFLALALALLAATSAEAAKVRSLGPWKATNEYLVTADLDGRTQPQVKLRERVDYLRKGQWVRIACQTHGETAYGSTLWDKVGAYYVPDRYVKTYTAKALVGAPSCAAPAPDLPKAPTRYVALGDSFSSGEGALDYLPEPPTRWAGCHRSRNAYSQLLAQRLHRGLVHDPARDFLACSFQTVPGLVNRQLGTLGADVAVVTVGIGGNDAGWDTAVRDCMFDAVKPRSPLPYIGKKGCRRIVAETFARTLPAMREQLHRAYTAIRVGAPRARVIVVGYPALFADSLKSAGCQSTGTLSVAARADLNRAAARLAGEIGAIARAYGFRFVDPRNAFEDHRVCGPKEDWLIGLTFKRWKNPPPSTFHPNRSGQAGLANLIADFNREYFKVFLPVSRPAGDAPT